MIFGAIKKGGVVHLAREFDRFNVCESICRSSIYGADSEDSVIRIDDTDPVIPESFEPTPVCSTCARKAPGFLRIYRSSRVIDDVS
jgi:hypothetical protein